MLRDGKRKEWREDRGGRGEGERGQGQYRGMERVRESED